MVRPDPACEIWVCSQMKSTSLETLRAFWVFTWKFMSLMSLMSLMSSQLLKPGRALGQALRMTWTAKWVQRSKQHERMSWNKHIQISYVNLCLSLPPLLISLRLWTLVSHWNPRLLQIHSSISDPTRSCASVSCQHQQATNPWGDGLAGRVRMKTCNTHVDLWRNAVAFGTG